MVHTANIAPAGAHEGRLTSCCGTITIRGDDETVMGRWSEDERDSSTSSIFDRKRNWPLRRNASKALAESPCEQYFVECYAVHPPLPSYHRFAFSCTLLRLDFPAFAQPAAT